MPFTHKSAAEEGLVSGSTSLPSEAERLRSIDVEVVPFGGIEPIAQREPGTIPPKRIQLSARRLGWTNFVARCLSVLQPFLEDIVDAEKHLVNVGGREAALLLAFASVAAVLVGGNTLPALILSVAASLFLILCGIKLLLTRTNRRR